jgi:hypothetical protein
MIRAFPFLLIFLFAESAPVFAFSERDIRAASEAAATNRAAAVQDIARQVSAEPASMTAVRECLYLRHAYDLWNDALRLLPDSAEIAEERLRNDLFTGGTDRVADDLTDLLRYRDSRSIALRLGIYLADQNTADACAPGLTNRAVFAALAASFAATGKLSLFDDTLLRAGNADPLLVLDWLSGNLPSVPRDARALLSAYPGLRPPEWHRLFALSAVSAGDYPAAKRSIDAGSLASTNETNRNRSAGLDVEWVLANSSFASGDFHAALDHSYRADRMTRPETGKLRFLCLLGLGETEGSRVDTALASVRPADARDFFSAFLDVMKNGTNRTRAVFDYTLGEPSNPGAERLYLPEAFLLAASSLEGDRSLSNACELVRRSLLGGGTNTGALSGFDGAFASDAGIASEVSGGRAEDYARYREASSDLAEGKTDAAREKLTTLASSTNCSPLVRALAVFELRKDRKAGEK